jgi:membrane protein implicated in regulation of membrane protease activity
MQLFWLIIIILLSIIEAFTINLVSIWFIVSGIITLVISLFTNNIIIQIAVFILLGVILLLSTKNILQKYLTSKTERTNYDRIIGMNGIVTEKITKNTIGEVKVDGKLWSAYADKTIQKDSIVEVLEINSTKIKVKEVEET